MTRLPQRVGATSPRLLFGFAAGAAVATVACGGIVAARLSQGDVRVGLLANVLLTVAVVGVMFAQGRPTASSPHAAFVTVLAQIVGAALGIALVHLVLGYSALQEAPWISERPPQFVNDLVAVVGPLAVVWAASRRPPNTIVLVATLAAVTAYRLTGAMWHVDAARFSYSVQDLVTGEFAGSAVGISIFRILSVV